MFKKSLEPMWDQELCYEDESIADLRNKVKSSHICHMIARRVTYDWFIMIFCSFIDDVIGPSELKTRWRISYGFIYLLEIFGTIFLRSKRIRLDPNPHLLQQPIIFNF